MNRPDSPAVYLLNRTTGEGLTDLGETGMHPAFDGWSPSRVTLI